MKTLSHSHAVTAFFDQHFDAMQSFYALEAHAYVKRPTTTTTNQFRMPCCATRSLAPCLSIFCCVCCCCCHPVWVVSFGVCVSHRLRCFCWFSSSTMPFHTQTVSLRSLHVLVCISFERFHASRTSAHVPVLHSYCTHFEYGVYFVHRVHSCSFNPAQPVSV